MNFWLLSLFYCMFGFPNSFATSFDLGCINVRGDLDREESRQRDNLIESNFRTNDSYVIVHDQCPENQHLSFTAIKVVRNTSERIFYIGENLHRYSSTAENSVWVLNTTKAPLVYKYSFPLVSLLVRLQGNSTSTRTLHIEDFQGDRFDGDISAHSPLFVLISSSYTKWGDVSNFSFTFKDSLNTTLETHRVLAYIIVCAYKHESNYQFADCRTFLVDQRVACQCFKNLNFFPMVLLFTVVTVSALVFFYTMLGKKEAKRIGHEQVLWILCSPRTVQHRYDLCFRLGCASKNFDFEKTMIDFDFITPDNRIMGQGRIKAHLLSPEEIGEVHFIMNRLTVLSGNSFASISFKHHGSDPSSKIFFYGMTITNCITGEKHSFPIRKYIRSTTVNQVLGTEENKSAEVPIVPLPPLANSEIVVFNLFIIAANGMFAYIIMAKSPFKPSVAEILGVSIGSGFLHVFMTTCYRMVVKHEETRHRLVLKDTSSPWKVVEVTVLAALLLSIGTLFACTAFLGLYISAPHVKTWASIWFFTSAVTTLFWVLAAQFDLAELSLYICTRGSLQRPDVEVKTQSQKDSLDGRSSSSITGSRLQRGSNCEAASDVEVAAGLKADESETMEKDLKSRTN